MPVLDTHGARTVTVMEPDTRHVALQLPEADACRALLSHAKLVGVVHAVLDLLERHPGWHVREEVPIIEMLRAAIARATAPAP